MSKWEDVTKLLNARFTVVRAEEYGTLVIKKAVLGVRAASTGFTWRKDSTARTSSIDGCGRYSKTPKPSRGKDHQGETET